MRTALLVARNDLRRRLRDRSAVVTAIVAPVVLAAIVGFAFGGDAGAGQPVLARVALADADDTPASQALLDATVRFADPGPGISVERSPSPAAALDRLERGAVSAVVVLPRGFTTRWPVPFPDVRFEPDSAIGQTLGFALAQGLTENTAAVRSLVQDRGLTPDVLAAVSAPPAITMVDAGGGTRRSLIGYFGPATAMVFLFFGVGLGARNVLAERQQGTLARLQVAPVPFSAVVAGKLLGIVGLSLVSVLVVWATTTWGLGATWGDPAGVVVLSLAVVLAMGAIALLVTVVARTEVQADALTAGIGFALALLGGNFFPPGALPPFFETLSRLTPNGWGLEGYGALAIDGRGLDAVWTPVVALLLIAAAFGAVAVLRFRTAVGA